MQRAIIPKGLKINNPEILFREKNQRETNPEWVESLSYKQILLMSTYTQILYQVVFSTKNRERTLSKANRDELFKYVSGILYNKKCHLYCINGVENHLHIITHVHPTIALSKLVKDIKLATSKYIKERKLFSNFNGWQNGYAAFTYSIDAKQNLIDYVKNQEEHHQKITYKDELLKLLSTHDIKFDPKYLL